MKIKDYLRGLSITLHSPLPAKEVAQRINKATPSIFNPFGSGVSGWSKFGYLRLCWKVPLISNGFQPVLAGSVGENLGATQIDARFGASGYIRVFLAFWFSFLCLLILIAIAALTGDGERTGNEGAFFLIIPLFGLAPIIFLVIFNWNADKELERILEFLEDEAQAVVVHDAQGDQRG